MTPLRCQGCGGSGCSWDCEPCMHGDAACGTKCMDDLCRGSAEHHDCDRCDGSGREPEWDDE